MTESVQYRRSGGVIPRRVAGETLLVPANARNVVPHSRAAELFVLNESAEALWHELETPKTVQDLARKLIDAYAIPPVVATADAEEFVRSLVSIGAVMPT
jgi:hypothetical protein